MKPALAFIGTLLFAYLVGSFIAVSFDIADWIPTGRAFIAIAGSVVAGFVALCVAGEL